MSATDLHLVRGQVRPRLRELLRHPAPWVALVLGACTALSAERLPSAGMRIFDVAATGFTFAAISMGACMSAIVLAIGLPGADRLRRWSQASGATPNKSLLSDLIFVLVWAALCQLALIATCVLALLFGGELPIAPQGWQASHGISLALGLAVFYYAATELLMVVITLVQIGVIIIAEERTHP